MIVTVIGLGLIGGSIALDIKKGGFATTVIGVDTNATHRKEAMELGLVDVTTVSLEEGIANASIVIIAIPVDKAADVLIKVLDMVAEGTTVLDVGSTKSGICKRAGLHPKRKQFVATHPIAGTEFSGPQSALTGLFTNKLTIISEAELSGEQHLKKAIALFDFLRMRLIHLEAEEHDRHAAFVSHLSHISSFALGLTVLEIEKDEQHILQMAGSGFESTVRLAKSSPEMWTPVLCENSENLVEALDSYIRLLTEFKTAITDRNQPQLKEMMTGANDIRRVLSLKTEQLERIKL